MNKTIEQQYLEAILKDIPSIRSLDYDIKYNAAKSCTAITEDVAIKFIQWADDNKYVQNHSKDWYSVGNEPYQTAITSQELFTLFKQQTGL